MTRKDTSREKKAPDPVDNDRMYGGHFVTGKVYGLLFMMRGSVPDFCIILGKSDDRVSHVEYVKALFAFTCPVDKARKGHIC